MELIKKYIHEVTRRLAENLREDISLELESTILDMLPDDFTDDDVYKVLNELGDPTVIAAGYRDRPMHLIGPKFYDIYISLLKLVMPIVAIVVFITHLIETIYTNNGSEADGVLILTLFGETVGVIIWAAMQTFFWITLVFAILERTIEPTLNVPLTLSGKKWTATDLNKTTFTPLKKRINTFEPSFYLFWTAIWVTVYFNAATIVGVYETTADTGLTFKMSLFNQETLLAFLVIIMIYLSLEVIKSLYMLIVRKWTVTLAIISSVVYLLSFTILTMFALHPHLINPAFAPYMADVIGSSVTDINLAILWTKWSIIAIIIILGSFDIYKGFKKAIQK